MHRRVVYIYLLNVPSFSSRYFNKIKTNVSFRESVRLIARNSLGVSRIQRVKTGFLGSRAIYMYNHATTNLAIYSNETSQDKLSEA